MCLCSIDGTDLPIPAAGIPLLQAGEDPDMEDGMEAASFIPCLGEAETTWVGCRGLWLACYILLTPVFCITPV